MIKYKLICKDCEQSFDSWFASSTEYEKLKKKSFLSCHNCNSNNVEKSLMAPKLMGKSIKDDMNEGKFVSDEIVNSLIEKLMNDPTKKNKLIFDGYPRSLSQAKYLDLLLEKTSQKIDHIFFLNVNKDLIIERIEKRKILENRSDDNTDTILKRYDTYMETTKPVLDFYSKNPNFHEINGTQEIDQITRQIEDFINV